MISHIGEEYHFRCKRISDVGEEALFVFYL